jgi:hypothetical protein
LTLFLPNIVYDFLFAPENPATTSEIVVFDLAKNRLVLLDVNREVKLEMTVEELNQLVAAQRESDIWRERGAFLLSPRFDVAYDEAGAKIELTSKQMSYIATVQTPPKSTAYPMYGQFLDAYAKLNATDPQKLPPFPRLELNRELKSRHLIPTEVAMTIELPFNGIGTRTISATSKHSVIWQLSKTDHERIETVNKHWTGFRRVQLAEYRNLPSGMAKQQ